MSGWIVGLLLLALVAPQFTWESVSWRGTKKWTIRTDYWVYTVAAILYVLETT